MDMKEETEDITTQERQRLLTDSGHLNEQEHTKYGAGLVPATTANENATSRQAPKEATMKVPSKTAKITKRTRREEGSAH